MILKFRETHIGNMEKGRRGKGGEGQVAVEGGDKKPPSLNGVASDNGLTTVVSLNM